MKNLLSDAVDTALDVDCSATGLAESATLWVKEWVSQQTMRSMTVDANTRRLLAEAAETTTAKMREAIDCVERLREELRDAVAAADKAAQWLATEAKC